jgi:hypothetical protein
MKSSGRLERCRKFGFDCSDDLEWRGWEPGGEYKLKLAMQNVSAKMQTIKYRLPELKYFGMEFPATAKVGPGMSYVVEVSFRPIVLEAYEDSIEFMTSLGTFTIPIRATLLSRSFSVPPFFEFGFCPTMEETLGQFQVVNDGELPLTFNWSVEAPFEISPRAGVLDPGSDRRTELEAFDYLALRSQAEMAGIKKPPQDKDAIVACILEAENRVCTVTARFFPKEGSVFVGVAVCTVDGLPPAEMKLTGVGKFTYLSTDLQELDFGDVQTGDSATRTFTITNQSLVNASLKIVNLEENEGDIFKFSLPFPVSIPPEETMEVTVTYSPHCTGMFSSEHFEIVTPGGNVVPITCQGLSVGPEISFSTTSMNFGDVISGHEVKRSFRISNMSTLDAEYQVLAEKDGVFEFSSVAGNIPCQMYPGKAGYIDLFITFKPTTPCNYWKRVFVLLKNQAPLYMDIFGTCYDDKRRPAPFSQRHIDAYRDREAEGQGLYSPDELQEMQLQSTAVFDATREIQLSEEELWNEIFLEYNDPSRPVRVEEISVDFGSCSVTRMSEYKTVTVVNSAHAKVTCNWILPNDWVKVFPESGDVLPNGGSTTFQISFRPGAENMYYGCTLEAFISFKTMRNFRLVTDKSFVPPWHVEVAVQGHTFPGGAEHFLPKVGLPGGGEPVYFPACCVPGAQHQTLALTNKAHTPLFFNMDRSLASSVFSCKPVAGLVAAHGMQMVALRFKPDAPTKYTSSMKAIFNCTPHNAAPFSLCGTGFIPSLDMENNGMIYFKPTCTGSVSERIYAVTNPSRMTVAFEWEIPPSVAAVLTIEPREGLIRGNETLNLSCVFAPRKAKKYQLRIGCTLRVPGQDGPGHKFWLGVAGQGSVGAVTFEPTELDYESIIIGGSKKKLLRLTNSSPCPMHWSFSIGPAGETAELAATEEYAVTKAKESALEFEATSGVLTAGSYRDLSVIMRPTEHARHDYTIYCQYSMQSDDSSTEGIVPPICSIKCYGALPLLGVTDVWCTGTHPAVTNEAVTSKRVQWDMLSLDVLNETLLTDLTPPEVAHNDPEGALADMQAYISSLDQFSLNFITRELGSQPGHLVLQFQNLGDLPLQWNIQYPDDIGIEPEHWAEKEAPTAGIVKQGFIIDNEIFSVWPRNGSLDPGQTQHLELAYNYQDTSYDCHELNVILQVHNGKQVVLRLTGSTLKVEQKCLQISENFVLSPTQIGAVAAPVQTMEIHNVGLDAIKFHIDVSAIEALCAGSFNFPVLTCMDPAGMIEPGKCVLVRFAFQPLEDQTYSVKLPISVVDGPSFEVTVTGRGYHPDKFNPLKLAPPPGSFPARTTMRAGGQLALVSHDTIAFGVVPAHAVNRRLVTVHNVNEHPIRFEWDLRHARFERIFDIQPSTGSIAPGKSCLCRVRMRATVPEYYDFVAACTVYDEHEEEMYEAQLRELQQLAEEAAEDEGMGNAPAKRVSRKRSKKRLSVVATSTMPRQPRVLFGKGTKEPGRAMTGGGATGSIAASSRLGSTSARSMASSTQGSALTGGTRTARTGTGAPSGITFNDAADEPEPPQAPRPYTMWTVITAGVAAARDHPGSFERPMDEHYVVKRGRPGAETLLTESGNLGMPLIETSLPPEPEAIGDLVPTVMDDAARAAAEQALSVLLTELTSDPEVKTSLAGIEVEATPYYAVLTQSRPASAASSRPTSPPDNTLGAPLADASPITAAVGEAADAKVITAAMDIPAAELDLSAELQSADAETAAGASDEYETTGVETAELSEMEAADTPPAVAPPLSTEKRASMLSEPFVEALMETTLEEALYNLMSEAIDGEFNLSVLPRQIVQNVRQEELPSTADVSTAL